MNTCCFSLCLCPYIRSNPICKKPFFQCYWFTTQPDARLGPHHLVMGLLDSIIYKWIKLYCSLFGDAQTSLSSSTQNRSKNHFEMNYRILYRKQHFMSSHHEHTTVCWREEKSMRQPSHYNLEESAVLVWDVWALSRDCVLHHYRRHLSRLWSRLIKTHNYWVDIQFTVVSLGI